MTAPHPSADVRVPRLMLVVTVDDATRRLDVVVAALAGGIDTVQIRDRRAASADLLAATRVLRERTRAAGALLLVNDRIDVALAADADGVHLPAASWPTAAAQQLLARAGRPHLVGRSTHAPDEASAAARDGADYVVLGPVFATPSKAAFGEPLGLAAITRARSAMSPRIPLIAIGGITTAHVPEVLHAGASGIAVIRAVLDAADPASEARSLAAALAQSVP